MKKIKKIGLLLGIGFMLVSNVSAKEMAVVRGGVLYDESNKKYLDVEEGTRVNTIEGLKNNNGYYVNYNNKKYFVQKCGLLDVETYSKWEKYKEENKPKFKSANGDEAFELVDFKFNEPYFNAIVDNYKPSGKTDSQVFINLMKYMADLDLTYRVIPGVSQWRTIKDGYTACYGGTYLQKLLLDKTNLKYRIVFERPANYETDEISYLDSSHIYAEVQIDGKWVNAESITLFNVYDFNTKKIKPRIKKDESTLYKIYLSNPKSCEDLEKVDKAVSGSSKYYNDAYYVVSGTYQANKKVKDDGFSAIVKEHNWREFVIHNVYFN